MPRRDASFKATEALADRGKIAFMMVFYDPNDWWMQVYPINAHARSIFAEGQIMSEREYVMKLYWMRNMKIKEEVLTRLSTVNAGNRRGGNSMTPVPETTDASTLAGGPLAPAMAVWLAEWTAGQLRQEQGGLSDEDTLLVCGPAMGLDAGTLVRDRCNSEVMS